jgi:hypothetical protein
MPFILKTDTLPDATEGQQVEITEPPYYGGHAIATGNEVFVWFSGAVQRLAWSGEVVRVDRPVVGRHITVFVLLIARACSDAAGVTELIPFRDIRDGSVLSSLSRKLYRFSHDKVAALSPAETTFLRGYFQ